MCEIFAMSSRLEENISTSLKEYSIRSKNLQGVFSLQERVILNFRFVICWAL